MAPALSADSITLSIPHAKPYHGIARLVVGGLAVRLELSYEQLEDLQLALESVLERDNYATGETVTVRLLVGSESVVMEIGPLDAAEVGADLQQESADEISLSRLLSALVDQVSLEPGDGGHRLRLEKRVSLTRLEAREPA